MVEYKSEFNSGHNDDILKEKYTLQHTIFWIGFVFILLPVYMNYVSLKALGDFKLFFYGSVYNNCLKYLKEIPEIIMFTKFTFTLYDPFTDWTFFKMGQHRDLMIAKSIDIYEAIDGRYFPARIGFSKGFLEYSCRCLHNAVHYGFCLNQCNGDDGFFLLPNWLRLNMNFEISETKAGYIKFDFFRGFKDWWFWHCKDDITDDSKMLQATFFFLFPIHSILCIFAWIFALIVSICVIGVHQTLIKIPFAITCMISGIMIFAAMTSCIGILGVCTLAFAIVTLVVDLICFSLQLFIFALSNFAIVFYQIIRFSLINVIVVASAVAICIYNFIVILVSIAAFAVTDGFILLTCLTNSELLYEFYGRTEYQFATTAAGLLVEDIPQFFLQTAYSVIMKIKYNASLSNVQIASFVISIWHLSMSLFLKLMTRKKPIEKWMPKAFNLLESVTNAVVT